MEPIIKVRNISKEYILSHRLPYQTFRDTLTDLVRKPFRLLQGQGKIKKEEFWALKDINFDIQRGESIGLIGANGSGKSTLLKILSQITVPTTGEITLRGRVASLLEVGTGFHPELTGRENIFLNGAILGMTKKEISRKFDEIVKFSGVEKFLDTPVKRYSSGMIVRLAFSVAAHLEPEILLVDEVLAVGDAEFQKKSLGKMNEVTKDAGRTIIFVSHNMEAIKKLCSKCILLNEGKIVMIDQTNKVIENYLHKNVQSSIVPLHNKKDRSGRGEVKFTDIRISNPQGATDIRSGEGLRIQLKYESKFKEKITGARVVIQIVNDDLQPVLRLDSNVTSESFGGYLDPQGQIVCETEKIHLKEGQYFANIDFLVKNGVADYVSVDCVIMASVFYIKTDIQEYGYKNNPDTCNYIVKYSFSNNNITN